MIRIDLRGSRRGKAARVLRAASLAAVVAAAGGAALYLVEQRYALLGTGRERAAPLAQERSVPSPEGPPVAAEPTLPAPVEGAPSAVQAPALAVPETAVPETEATQPAASTSGGAAEWAPAGDTGRAEEPSTSVSAPEGPARPAVTAPAPPVASAPRRASPEPTACAWSVLLPVSPICLRLGSLADTLVDEARLTGVTCRSSGEFTLEGVAAAPNPMAGLVAVLQGLPSRVTLSWHSAAPRRPQSGGVQAFALQGQFEHQSAGDLEGVAAGEAEVLFSRVTAWARSSGVERLNVSRPPQVALDSSRVHWRQKMQGVGTYRQIHAFVGSLNAMGSSACVGELAIVPVLDEAIWPPRARLYAALDLVVRRP